MNTPHYFFLLHPFSSLRMFTHDLMHVLNALRITSIRMNPISDTFMTCSRDKTIRIWDVKSDKCQAQIPSSEVAVADYDCSGIVFGTGCNGTDVRLYDSRAFDKGPFLRKVLQYANPQGEIMDLKFSGDGQYVVALMSDNVAHLLDAYDLETKHRFGSGQGSVSEGVNTVCFSPCGQYLYGGTPEGRILVWNVQTGLSVADLGGHSDQVNAVVFNPKKMLFASACTSLSMWLPSI
jgi:COMPASS component SWD2